MFPPPASNSGPYPRFEFGAGRVRSANDLGGERLGVSKESGGGRATMPCHHSCWALPLIEVKEWR